MGGPTHHTVSGIDGNHLLYGNFIGLQYCFESPLDSDVLAKAVDALVRQFPALLCSYYSKAGAALQSVKTVSLQIKSSPARLADILASPDRPSYINQPERRDVLKAAHLYRLSP